MAVRTGRQTPTSSYVLDYSRTLAQEAFDIYEKTKNEVMPWQKNVLKDIMAVQSDGLWVHQDCGYEVSRRNGKSEVLYIRELWGLIRKGEQIAHTAHRISTSYASYNRMVRFLKTMGYTEDDFSATKSKGTVSEQKR